MDSTIFALASVTIAITVQRIFLWGYNARLRAREQAFQFHAMRDNLQLLVAEGKVDTSSLTYDFLIKMFNFAIRNAGLMKLTEILILSEKVKKTVNQITFEMIISDLKKHDPAVQELAQQFFFAFANMLIANDWVVRSGVRASRTIKPAIIFLNRIAIACFHLIIPQQVEAVRDARRFFDWGNRLSRCQ